MTLHPIIYADTTGMRSAEREAFLVSLQAALLAGDSSVQAAIIADAPVRESGRGTTFSGLAVDPNLHF